MWGRQTNVAPELVPDPYNLTKKKTTATSEVAL